jgi:hypothetical protein
VIPVSQITFVAPGVRGDCFRACIASILELSIEDVPHFVAIKHDWWGETQKWLHGRGLSGLWLGLDPERMAFANWADPLYCILSGPSPRGEFQHSVVGQVDEGGWSFKTVHDPHPSKDGLLGEATSVLFLLPWKS